MATIYDSWKSWHDAEGDVLQKQVVDYVIHPAGLDGKLEWFNTGLRDAEYTISELKLQKQESVLEYGCGNGRILRHLDQYNSHGVDIVPAFVEEAREKGCDAYLLEDFHEKVDKVYSLTVFIHLRHDQARTALKYIHEHLVDGGTAHIQALIYQKDKDSTNFSDMTSYKKQTFIDMAEECGFEVLETFENPGDIDKGEFGIHHNAYQVLRKV
jgi:SAM-dependent methyltransferase